VYEDPVRFLITLERAEKDALEEIAEKQGRSVASLVREALQALLKRRRR
jgi:predicted transcriptional regulator